MSAIALPWDDDMRRKSPAAPGISVADATRRGAMMFLTGALASCGGGGLPEETDATAEAEPLPTPAPSTPVPAQAGALNRNGLVQTFSEDFSSLTQDFAQKMPLNGKWQSWLNNHGIDRFYSRTLHEKTGEEQQYYLDQYILNKHCAAAPNYKAYDPFSLVDGPNGKVLRITARRMDALMVNTLRDKLGIAQGLSPYESTKYWSSGCLSTYEGFRQTYGVFEARVKLSTLAGSWPAFWMLVSDRGYSVWPPEIDIMDNFPQNGALDRWISGGIYAPGKGFGANDGGMPGRKMPYNVRGEWRTIALEWTDKNMIYYADDIEFYRAPTPSNFHENMFMMLNLAIVGQDNKWADKPLASTNTIAMDIDWVRVWKRA